MSNINLPSNSNKSKAQEKKIVEKVTHGKVVKRKKGFLQKAAGALIADDVTDIKRYLILDVLIPALKDMFVDLMENGARMIAYGSTAGSRKHNIVNGNYTYYNGYYSSSNKQTNRPNEQRSKDFDDFLFAEKGDAEMVLDQLLEILGVYGQVSVNDFKDLIGKTGDFTDANWGWTNLSSACTKRVNGGYIISLPRVQQL